MLRLGHLDTLTWGTGGISLSQCLKSSPNSKIRPNRIRKEKIEKFASVGGGRLQKTLEIIRFGHFPIFLAINLSNPFIFYAKSVGIEKMYLNFVNFLLISAYFSQENLKSLKFTDFSNFIQKICVINDFLD